MLRSAASRPISANVSNALFARGAYALWSLCSPQDVDHGELARSRLGTPTASPSSHLGFRKGLLQRCPRKHRALDPADIA